MPAVRGLLRGARLSAATVLGTACALTVLYTPVAQAAAVSWLTYGFDSQRSGYNGRESTVGPANAAAMHKLWSTNLGGVMIAQTVEAAAVRLGPASTNVLYEGTEGGTFYAINASDGGVIWEKSLGSERTRGCTDMPHDVFGIGGAGAVSFRSPGRGVVYVAGGDGAVHALDLATGSEQPGWPVRGVFTAHTEHVYGGLTLFDGRLYITVASHCDIPPYHGGTTEINVASHRIVSRFYAAGPPSGGISGGGIWGPGGVSVDPSNGEVFAATGNALTSPENYRYSDALVELTPSLGVLSFTSPWVIGMDVDFGATPILFHPAGCPSTLIGVKNKSGVLFIYSEGDLGAGYRQRIQIADINDGQFNGVPAWDPATNMLYVGNSSNAGPFLQGMIALRAARNCSLSLAWQRAVGPSSTSVSPPTVADGVVYYGDGNGNTEYAFNASNGKQLWSSGSTIVGAVYAAPTVINGELLVPSWDHRLYAFGP